MGIDFSRLRAGEIVAGSSAVLLAVFMFALPWYAEKSASGVSRQLTGWEGLSHLRWLLVVTILVGVAITYFQAACRAPAIPVTLCVVATVLALLAILALIYRVLINVPGPDSQARVGAYLGLVSTIGILVGAFASMRKEGIAPQDGPGRIETLSSSAADGS